MEVYVHFRSIDDFKTKTISYDPCREGCTEFDTAFDRYYIYNGSLNEDFDNLIGANEQKEHGVMIVNSKYWAVFFNPDSSLLRRSDGEEWVKVLKIDEYLIKVEEDKVHIFVN